MKIVAYAPDLLDQSKIRGTFPDIRFVPKPEDLSASDANVCVIDISRIKDFSKLDIQTPCVGFGSHVDVARMEKAKAAGFQVVVPRSKFFARMTDVVDEAIGSVAQ